MLASLVQLRTMRTKKRGEIVTLSNVGLHLLDVVTTNDSRAGISPEPCRVRAI